MIMLDTNACIEYLNGINEIRDKLSDLDDLVHTTSITVYEVNIGLERTKRKVSQNRYNELYKIWLEFISSMEVFSLGYKEAEKAAEVHDNLEAKGQMIDDNDILIAGIMLSNGITKILTRNAKHFERIPGIEIIQY